MRIKTAAILGLAWLSLIGLTACSTVTPALNIVDVRATDFSKEMKTGTSCQKYILGFIGPFGDASIIDAAKDANISKIEVVDYNAGFYLLFSKKCTVVYGN